MRTLIVGGGGFVGLAIAERLLSVGRPVVLFDRFVPAAALAALRRVGPDCAAVTGDVRDPAALAALLAPGFDAVVCGAAITADGVADAADPEAILDVNLTSLVRVLRAARDAGVRRVVNLSSVAALGAAAFPAVTPTDVESPSLLDEGRAADPVGLYGITKFAGERVAARLADLWGLDVRSVRLSAVFGRWERLTGARSTPSPQFQIAAHALAGRPALLDRPGLRDWIYAPDVADAVLRLIDAPAPVHALYHVSNPAPFTVLDWGLRFAAAWPLEGFVCRLAAAGEPANVSMHGAADRASMTTARARDDLGFSAVWDAASSARDYAGWAGANRWCFDPTGGHSG